MNQVGGLQSDQQNYQHCFIGHSQGASWRETFEQVCEEVLPNFGLTPWYANKQYKGNIPLREKVVNMIATTRYGIYDLSSWRKNDQSAWIMPRNVLIELGMAIALNRPMLLLRHGKNRECSLSLPACLQGIDIGEFGDGKKLLKETLAARLPSLAQHTPKQDWLNRYCHFGNLVCPHREAHPQAQQWGRQKIHIHVADGAHASQIDCSDFRDLIEEDVINRFNNLEFTYLDNPTSPQGCKFRLCSHCQGVRRSPFAIYRITPHTSADTFIAIGISIAMEKQFKYPITKILITGDEDSIPSLLKGYEIVVEQNYTKIKDRLNSILPGVIEEVKQAIWKPKPLPFEVFLPTQEHVKSEKSISTGTSVESDTQVQDDEGNSSQQEAEENRNIGQMGHYWVGAVWDKFTERAKNALFLADEEARLFQYNYIGTEHLMLGLVREGEGAAAKVLANLGVNLNNFRSAVEFIFGSGGGIILNNRVLTLRGKKVIALAVDEARRRNHDSIDTEHILLGLLGVGEGIAVAALEHLGVTLEMVRTQTVQVLSNAYASANVDSDKETQRNEPLSVFISYAYEDKQFLKKLCVHLRLLEHKGLINVWYDGMIYAGMERRSEIDGHLDAADMILLLVSTDFLNSDSCYEEVQRAMERHERGEARVIPIIFRHVDWHGEPFGKLQALPTGAKPISSWSDRGTAFSNVAKGIHRAVEEWRKRR